MEPYYDQDGITILPTTGLTMYKPLATLITAFDSHGIFVASAEHRYIDDQGNHALGFWRVMRRGEMVVTVKHESEARSVLRGWGGVKLVDSDRKY